MKKLIIIIAIFMIFVLLLGNLNKIDNVISDISSKFEDTTAPGTSSGDVTAPVTTYNYNIQLRESGTNKYITTFELTSTKSIAYFSVDYNNDIWLKADDGAKTCFDTENWTTITLSQTTVYPTTLTVYVNYTSTNTGGDSTGDDNIDTETVSCTYCGYKATSSEFAGGCPNCNNEFESDAYETTTCSNCGYTGYVAEFNDNGGCPNC